MSWTFSVTGTPVQVQQQADAYKSQSVGIPHPEDDIRHGMCDLIHTVMDTCGSGAMFILSVSASGSQNPETNNPSAPKPSVKLSITS
jgi:hypothetical protein